MRSSLRPRATMRAVRLHGPGLEPRLEEVVVPRPGPGQALVRVQAAGVCHTELQLMAGTLNPGVWPLTPGHEIAGEVVELGTSASSSAAIARQTGETSGARPSPRGPWFDRLTTNGLTGRAQPPEFEQHSTGSGWSEGLMGPAVGTRVLVYYGAPCEECAWCAGGQEQVCPNGGPQPGLTADGGFAEFVRVPVECLLPLPPTLEDAVAAPLGCAAATAYHALHGVAAVAAGETLVVYGVGGVALPLIQLARLTGARVLAVGRSSAKLELAAELGAETIDASTQDPVLAVRRLTGGEGADVVFELVGSAETMPAALDMLRRKGRLVFVGYGGERLALDPLRLVLRETRVLGSLGNTRVELEEVVRLAAQGALRVPVAGTYPLEAAGSALTTLREGRLLGRAILLPGLLGEAEPHVTAPGANAATVVPRLVVQGTSPRTTDGAAVAQDGLVAAGVDTAGPPLEAELMRFVARGVDASRDDATFNDLALRLFAYQFERNQPYRALCVQRGRTPGTVAHWREIPAVPIAAFKETLLVCEPTDGATEFNSSGTTKPERKSRHFHPGLALYDLNARLNFKAHVLPDRERMPLLVLYPRQDELPHSSLAHWLTLMVESFGTAESGWYVSETGGLDAAALSARLRTAEQSDESVGLLAASFGLVHFLEHCQESGVRFQLPDGSRVMDTGGYKGRSREYPQAELYGMVGELLGVPEGHVVNMYGMTEHGTQFLDDTLRHHLREPAVRVEPIEARVAPGVRRKVVPPWARTLVVDPESLAEVAPGERGLLLHVDLINRASVAAVLSEDLGYASSDDRFVLLGRAQGTEARGCSIALDELLSAVRTPP